MITKAVDHFSTSSEVLQSGKKWFDCVFRLIYVALGYNESNREHAELCSVLISVE